MNARAGGGMRKRIAVLLDMFDAKYQAELVRQLRIAAEQRHSELIVFPGGGLESELRGGARRRAVFDLVNAASIDGHDVITTLRASTLSLLALGAPERAHAEDLFQLARSVTGEAVVRVQATGRLTIERTFRDLNDLGTALAQCSSQAMFAPTLHRLLPRLGVRQAFVAAYREPSRAGGPRRATLHYCLDDALHFSDADGEPYPAHEILPARLWREVPSLNWVVLPLFFRDHEQGFALLDLRVEDGAFYEAIRLHLCVALDGFEPRTASTEKRVS